MPTELSATAQRVQSALRELGLSCEVMELAETTRSAKEAAQAIGCQVAQIAKSLVFKGGNTNRPFLVITSGSNRVDEKKLSTLVGEPIEKADADFVREKTGYVIGGVPPLGHVEKIKMFIDEDLMKYTELWAAAGTPHAVFKLAPGDLEKISNGKVIQVK